MKKENRKIVSIGGVPVGFVPERTPYDSMKDRVKPPKKISKHKLHKLGKCENDYCYCKRHYNNHTLPKKDNSKDGVIKEKHG